MSRGKRWVFTLNNYVDEDVERLRIFGESDDCGYLVYGREVGVGGTPHLQGFVLFVDRKRFIQVQAVLGRRCHIESARGTNQQAREYCVKDGEFVEFGTFPAVSQGRRSDVDQFVDWCRGFFDDRGEPPSERLIATRFPALFLRYRRHLSDLSLHLCSGPVFDDGPLRPWQQGLYDELEVDPDDRTVLFVYDSEGGKGKTWFQRYLLMKRLDDCQMLSVGKRDDIAHAIDVSRRLFLFNVPRGGMEFLQYTILEQLKDRCVFSPKYESRMKLIYHNVHVVVFCNEYPDMNKMTGDRYRIIELT